MKFTEQRDGFRLLKSSGVDIFSNFLPSRKKIGQSIHRAPSPYVFIHPNNLYLAGWLHQCQNLPERVSWNGPKLDQKMDKGFLVPLLYQPWSGHPGRAIRFISEKVTNTSQPVSNSLLFYLPLGTEVNDQIICWCNEGHISLFAGFTTIL